MAAPSQLLLVNTLKKAAGLLGTAQAELKTTILRQCQLISQPSLRISVFGPFNYGKSTLLNALLGQKALPIDLVPTTGVAITLVYGPELTSCITLTDGTMLKAPGIELLQRYATLDEQRHTRQNVAAVTVEYPHPLLQAGVELIDLPGTDDREMQNELVCTNLLETDIVIQLLDGRRLMTLTEREHLRNWLVDRGITTVLFVVNFLNLVEPDDRRQVMSRLQVLAQDFWATLPNGMNNLYAVDALPALRAKLKGDTAAVAQTGMPVLESALYTLVQTFNPQPNRMLRLLPLFSQIQKVLQQQLQELETKSLLEQQRVKIKQRAQVLLRKGFRQSLAELRDWLQLKNLLDQYQHGLATALHQNRAHTWLEETLQPVWKQKKRAVTEWVYQACDLLEQPRPVDLWVGWQPPGGARQTTPEEPQHDGLNTVAIAAGWVLGGPMGAAVLNEASQLLSKAGRKSSTRAKPTTELSQEAARTYLAHFSKTALAAADQYKMSVKPILYQSVTTPSSQQQWIGQQTLLANTLTDLQQLQASITMAESTQAK